MTNTDMPQRKIWISDTLRQDLKKYWRLHTDYPTESDLLRSIVDELALGGVQERKLAKTDGPGTAYLKVRVDPERWATAMANAEASGLSMHSLIRRRLLKMMETDDAKRASSG